MKTLIAVLSLSLALLAEPVSASERSKADLLIAVNMLSTQLMFAYQEAQIHEMLMDMSCAKTSRAASRAALPRVDSLRQAARADEAAFLATGRTPHLTEFEKSFVEILQEGNKARLNDVVAADYLVPKYSISWNHYAGE